HWVTAARWLNGTACAPAPASGRSSSTGNARPVLTSPACELGDGRDRGVELILCIVVVRGAPERGAGALLVHVEHARLPVGGARVDAPRPQCELQAHGVRAAHI